MKFQRIVRGGPWFNFRALARAARRDFNLPARYDFRYGFRVVAFDNPSTKEERD